MPNDKVITLDNLRKFKEKCDETYAPISDFKLTITPKAPEGDETLLVNCNVKVYEINGFLIWQGVYVGTPLVISLPRYQTYRVEVQDVLSIGGVVYFNPTATNASGIMTENINVDFVYASTGFMTTLQDVKTFLSLEEVSIDVKRTALVNTEFNNFTVNIILTNPASRVQYTMPIRFMAVDTYTKLVDGVEVQFVGARCMFKYTLPDSIPFDEREQVLATGETFQSGIYYYQGTSATVGDQSFTPLTEGVDYEVGDTVGENIYKHAWSDTQDGTGNLRTSLAMRYGSNVYHESNIDKWLNAQGDDWFEASHIGDILANWYKGKKGFKSWFKPEDLAIIEENVAYGVYERSGHTVPNNTIYRQFVLPSGTNIAGSVNANEGLCFDYWKYLNGGIISNSANANRTITKVNATTSKQTIWLRSPLRSYSCRAWYLSSSGFVNYGYPCNADAVAPAFTI